MEYLLLLLHSEEEKKRKFLLIFGGFLIEKASTYFFNMAFILNLKPVEIGKIQKRLQKERARQAKQIQIKKALEKGIQENPIKRNQFDID